MDINVAIVGFGKAGEFFHAPFINAVSGFHLSKVLERHHQRSKECYPWVEVVTSYEALLADDAIQLIIITTPNDMHFEMAKAALEKGKHVVVDKPFTCTVQEAEKLIALAKEANRLLTVFQNRRLDGTFLTVKDFIEKKVLGVPLKLEINFDRFRPDVNKEAWREGYRKGGGVLYDLGAHLIDQALVLFGKPETIEASVEKQRVHAQVDDYFKITFRYPENLEVVLHAGMLVSEKTPNYVLTASEGKLIFPELDPQEAALKTGIFPGNEDWPAEIIGFIETRGLREKKIFPVGNYALFYENLAHVINKEEQALLVKPEEAKQVIEVICALKERAK